MEALETIAADQPLVARSIPKHAKITKKEDKSMRNCLFEQEVIGSSQSFCIIAFEAAGSPSDPPELHSYILCHIDCRSKQCQRYRTIAMTSPHGQKVDL